ncbi:MAG: vWA domain-containing protein [Acidobacteriota bacterium]
MFFLNLSLGEFLAVWGLVSGGVLALYLLDRSRRKIRVATLRFWTPSERPPEAKHRKRIQQPWSMLLQLLAIGLLLAALAQLRLGSPDRMSRDHVLVLDSSAWMAGRSGPRSLLDQAKRDAILWLRSLPAADRVMLVRADALPTPATVFATNRPATEQAILETRPGASALNLRATLDFARQMQRQHGSGLGDIVLAGALRSYSNDLPAEAELPANLRLLPVKSDLRNVGIRKVTLRRSPADPQLWEVFVAVKNYSRQVENAPLAVTFGSAPVGSARLTLPPGAEETARIEFRTKAAGYLEARLVLRDSIAEDNGATLELPEQKLVRVMVYTREPALLRPLLNANRWLTATYAPPAEYKADADAELLILDRFAPTAKPLRKALWIEPPVQGAPLAMLTPARGVKLTGWRNEHPMAVGLRSLDLRLAETSVFAPSANVTVVAESEAGAVAVASPDAAYLGFHPGRGALRFELTAPLLMANTLAWLAPEVLRRREVTGESVGNVRIPVDGGRAPSDFRVLGEGDLAIPFSLVDGNLQFYSAQRGLVRVRTGAQEQVYSLSLPDIADTTWDAPAKIRRGIPRGIADSIASRDLWQWLAMAGGLLLLLEWLWFGRSRLPAVQQQALPGLDILRRFTAPFRKAS